jgi:cell division protein FtsB
MFMAWKLALITAVVIALLQYRLWRGDGGIEQVRDYERRVAELQREIKAKQERNSALYAEVLDLRNATEATEELARHDLGMVKQEETFFQVIE